MEVGRLIIAGTPIGAAVDASERLKTTLSQADLIAAEDTRVAHRLLRRLGVETEAQMVAYFEGNENQRTAELVSRMLAGQTLVLISDAGMPSVSDPGFRLVSAAISAGIVVTSVPGPSAVLTALALSGLPTDRFCFEGFLPRKQGERRRRLAELADETRTMVFFEAPHRLADFLADAAQTLGDDRPGAVCRELTKPHEEIIRGGLAELHAWAKKEVRGEVTLVVGGSPALELSMPDALVLVRERIESGQRLSGAVDEVAKLSGVARRRLYAAALADQK